MQFSIFMNKVLNIGNRADVSQSCNCSWTDDRTSEKLTVPKHC